jgi:hypothetical protein
LISLCSGNILQMGVRMAGDEHQRMRSAFSALLEQLAPLIWLECTSADVHPEPMGAYARRLVDIDPEWLNWLGMRSSGCSSRAAYSATLDLVLNGWENGHASVLAAASSEQPGVHIGVCGQTPQAMGEA